MVEVKRTRRRKGRRTFGSTRQLPSGRWQASYRAPDGTRRIAPQTFSEAADANAWLRTVETEISAGDWRSPEVSRVTFGSFAEGWLKHRTDLRPTTRELYEGLWRRWLKPDLEALPIGAMTPETWRTWFLKITSEHPTSTQPAKAYRLARTMLNQAVDDGLLKTNPCRVKGAGREQAGERPVVMPEQVTALADAIEPRYKAMVYLASYCSLRFGELAGLRRRRIDILHRTITIEEQAQELANGSIVFGPPKTKAGQRVVSFPVELVPIVEDHLAQHVGAGAEDLVFSSPEGHPLRRTKFRGYWSKARNGVGVSDLHFHDLRHSGLTWSAAAGATTAELMHRAGHATPTMAMRYQHSTTEREKAIADKLGALLRAEETAAGADPPAQVVRFG